MNKYQKLYEALIDFRKNIQPICTYGRLSKEAKELNLPPFYGEYHHIKMVKIFPEFENDPDNIICLTTYEHILAHKYLALWYKEKYGKSSEQYHKAHSAYFFMTISRDKVQLTDEEATKIRLEEGRLKSLRTKGKPLSQKNKDSITKTWQTERKRKEQSERLKKMYNENPEYRKKISRMVKKRYTDPKERKKMRQANLEYFRNHPEAKKKHSDDIKGRTYLFNQNTHETIRIKRPLVDKYLMNGWTLGIPIYHMPMRGKNSGKISVKYICPWEIESSSYLKVPKGKLHAPWTLQNPKDHIVSKCNSI